MCLLNQCDPTNQKRKNRKIYQKKNSHSMVTKAIKEKSDERFFIQNNNNKLRKKFKLNNLKIKI